MLIFKNCWGDFPSVPGGVCASKPWSLSSACKNLRPQHPPGAEIWSSEKVDLLSPGCMSYTLLLADKSSLSTHTLVFRFWISLCFRETFAIEVWSCPKSTIILHLFGRKVFWGRTPEFFHRIIKLNTLPIMWQSVRAIGRWSLEISRWKKEKNRREWNRTNTNNKINFFGKLYFGPLGALFPQIFASGIRWPRSANYITSGTGGPPTIFLTMKIRKLAHH